MSVSPAHLLCVVIALIVGCRPADPQPTPEIQARQKTHPVPHIRSASNSASSEVVVTAAFAEVSRDTGFEFQHQAGRTLDYRFNEIVGSGAALFDYDNDGDLDVYLVQSGPAKFHSVSDRLFRNDSVPGDSNHPWKFTDVTDQSGIDVTTGYGQGVTCGDVDRDGDIDLFITNFGRNQFLRNNGDGTFTDATLSSGLALDRVSDERWSTSATFVDFDRDGWLDLYLCNYVVYTADSHKPCYGASGRRDYCGPNSYAGEADQLFRNDGHGNFVDVSAQAGIASLYGAGLGVACADFNGDSWVDIYVANDGSENRLWINQRNGQFEDVALLYGCAFNSVGAAEAGMGVDAADFDNDGDEDLFLAHLTGETNTLYQNEGTTGFVDRTTVFGLAGPSQTMTSFGTGWIDFNNDGRLDIAIANGTVKRENGAVTTQAAFPKGQPNQLFVSHGDHFSDVSHLVPGAFGEHEMSRGLAFGDLDNDGDLDFLVTNNDGPARLYRNEVGHRNPWIGLRLLDADGKQHQLGTKATLRLSDGHALVRRSYRDGSYCSSRDPRVLFGIPTGVRAMELEIHWPDGSTETLPAPPQGRYSIVRQGSGTIESGIAVAIKVDQGGVTR